MLYGSSVVSRLDEWCESPQLSICGLTVSCWVRAAVRALLVRPIESVDQVGHPA